MSIQEGFAAPGSDSCHFDGSSVDPHDHVTGGIWPVAGGDVPGQHNQWGYDYIGVTKEVVDYYRVQAPAHGKAIPCGFAAWQSLFILCQSLWQVYTPWGGNLLSTTINPGTVQNCRDDITGTACQTIFY
jgi:hypothetical protein